jgi:multimeric flavodoxin WrbA/rubredoxin
MKVWKCLVCGYIYKGERPPSECPMCSSSSKDFVEVKGDKERLRHDGKKFDVLLINGSSHRGHNTDILVEIAESALKKRNVNYRRFDLNALNIQHCWCCYSMKDEACTYPCRNQIDDMPALHEMIVDSKAVIIASPINWNNMSARLKDFLDRLTCLQNLSLIGKENLTYGKTLGILVDGHEDGALKTAFDIFTYFQQMGYIFAPFGFAYRTHRAGYDAKTDNEFFGSDKKIIKDVEGVVSNVIETIKLNLEEKLKDKIAYICE